MLKPLLLFMFVWNLSLFADTGTSQKHLSSITPSVSAEDISPDTDITIEFESAIKDSGTLSSSFLVTSNNDAISGDTRLSQDKKSIIFDSHLPLESVTCRVRLSSLELQGTEQQLCPGLWNQVKAFVCEKFGLFCKRVCYNTIAIQTEPVEYSFSVADTGAKVLSISLSPTTADLNENQTAPISVTALLDDNTTELINDKISWKSSDPSVAKVEQGKITAYEEGTALLTATYSDTIKATLDINVYKAVDGYTLPHDPGDATNLTLLGIDANHNGVRDDVERWIHLEMIIYNGYVKVERAIAMQIAKAAQMALADPTNKDDKVHKAITASVDCWTYYAYSKSLPFNDGVMEFSRTLKDKVFNTKERLKTYFQYDATLAGRVFTSTPTLQTKEQCETNIDEL